jgi:hypothetical protein
MTSLGASAALVLTTVMKFTICSDGREFRMHGVLQSGGVIQGIVALLFALADLAEDAASAPCHIRARMLLVLRLAESPARSIAYNSGRFAAAACEDDSSAAALRLAQRLRMLACLLFGSLPAPRHTDRSFGHPHAGELGLPRRRLAQARSYFDTS